MARTKTRGSKRKRSESSGTPNDENVDASTKEKLLNIQKKKRARRSRRRRPKSTTQDEATEAATEETEEPSTEETFSYVKERMQSQSDRISCQMIFLTYSGLTLEEASREAALETMKNYQPDLKEYAICREEHEDPAEPRRKWHIHALFWAAKKYEIKKRRHCTLLDMIGEDGRPLHPEIMGVGLDPVDRLEVHRYITKEDESPLRKLHVDVPEKYPSERRRFGQAWAFALNESADVRAGMRTLRELAPHVYYIHGSQVRSNLSNRVGCHQPSKYTIFDFTLPPLDLSKPLVLSGLPGAGKSQFARAHGKYPLMVFRIEDMRKINEDTDILVLDDMSFRNWEIADIKALLSIDITRTLPARYSNVEIPANLKMIFTTNEAPTSLPHLDGLHSPIFPVVPANDRAYEFHQLALRRRYNICHITSPLFTDPQRDSPGALE